MSGTQKYVRRRFVNAVELGVNGVTLATERTSSSLATTGYNQITLAVNFTTRSAATNITVKMDFSDDSGTTWFPIQSASTSSGTATMSDLVYTKTTSVADTFAINLACNYDLVRFKVDGAAGAAGDILSMTATLGVV